jgi:hypothetical protein
MSFAERIRPSLFRIRAIPGRMGLRPYRVDILRGSWDGAYVGRGTELVESVRITEANEQNPKVRFLNDEELALSGLGKGAATIGPITPDYGDTGTALSKIQPAVLAGETVHVLLTGPKHPTGARYAIVDVATDPDIAHDDTSGLVQAHRVDDCWCCQEGICWQRVEREPHWDREVVVHGTIVQ